MRKGPWTAAGLLALFLSAAPSLLCAGKDAGGMIVHANSVIMSKPSSGDDVKNALIEILDASLLILPKTDSTAECRSRIEVAKSEFDQKSLFTDKAHQHLSLAYRLVTGGKRWQFPAEISGDYREKDVMEKAKKACQVRIDSALTEWKNDRREESVRYLLEYVLMVITPVERQG